MCTDACQKGCSGPTKGGCEIVAQSYETFLGQYYCGGSSCSGHCQGWSSNQCTGAYCSYMCINYCDWGGTGNGCTGGCGLNYILLKRPKRIYVKELNMNYDEYLSQKTIYEDAILDNPFEYEDEYNLREFKEWYETQLEIQNRPRKPDVINNVSINSPYLIDLNEYREKWSKYEIDHEKSLKSFYDENRIVQFMSDRHGYDKKYPYLYDGRLFDMPFDLALYIYCVDHDWDIEFKPQFYGDDDLNTNGGRAVQCNPDYCINGDKYIIYLPKHLRKTEMVGLEDKETGDKISVRKFSIPEKYSWIMSESSGTNSDSEPQCGINLMVLDEDSDFNEEIWNWMYDHYSDGYIPLFQIGVPFPWPNPDFRDISPSGLIRHFHKSIYDAHYMDEPSALEVWDNKEVFKRLAINRLKYVGQCDVVTMLHGLNIAKCAVKVSVFKPTLAKNLIETYLYDAKDIFDPFSGFSGRMFGAMECGIPYIGRDVSEIHVEESKQIIDFINRNPQLKHRYSNMKTVDLDVANAITSYGVYDCLLTCPPYAVYKKGVLKNIEDWRNPNQEVLTCDQWIDICLQNYKCRKYLFVVDDSIVKYRNFIVGSIGNKGHMGRNVEFIVYIDFTSYFHFGNQFVNVNGSCGWTPYDTDQTKEYQDSIGIGKTPFDI